VAWDAVGFAEPAQRATSEIPIVFVFVPDPVGLKIVVSLARPDGNITGLTHVATDIVAKRIEIFREMLPGLSRLALLVNPNDPGVMRRNIDEAQAAARYFDIPAQPVEVRTPRFRARICRHRSGARGWSRDWY
jgi:putative tryptophan/tyrosine transport system substrate-binding protein